MNLAIRNHVSNKKHSLKPLKTLAFLTDFGNLAYRLRKTWLRSMEKCVKNGSFLPPKHSFLSVNT